jgi:hypothetical protein
MPTKPCRQCGREFEPQTAHSKFCSGDCFRAKEREYSNSHTATYSPERRRANIMVGGAIARGDLVPQPCETCGSTYRVEAHHDDYAQPLSVRWLCKSHHKQHHQKFGPGKSSFRADDLAETDATPAFTPRSQRCRTQFERLFNRDRANGIKAVEAAERAIRASFGQTYRINDEKLALERAMRGGAADPLVRIEYGFIAEMCPSTLEASVSAVERAYRSEIRERKHRSCYGLPLPSPSREERLHRARLFLRWYRRFGNRDRHPFFWLRDALTTSPAYHVEAAE